MTTSYLFDTETTDKDAPEIIESSMTSILITNGVIEYGAPLTQRFKPSGRIKFGAMATHHIMDEDLVDCRHLLSVSILCAYPKDSGRSWIPIVCRR